MASDHYEVLGVARDASGDDIKRAYRRLARELHPDANPGDQAAEDRFKEVSAAYEVVGDADKRAEYDEARRMGPMAGGFGPGGPGGFGGAGRPRPGQPSAWPFSIGPGRGFWPAPPGPPGPPLPRPRADGGGPRRLPAQLRAGGPAAKGRGGLRQRGDLPGRRNGE